MRIQVTRCLSFRTPPLQFTRYKNPITVRFCTVEFVVIIYIIHIGKSPRLRLLVFRGLVFRVTNALFRPIDTRAERYSGLCAHYYYIRVRVRRTRYTHYVHRIRVNYTFAADLRERTTRTAPTAVFMSPR